MATRRARVKMVPNFAAGNRGRARPGKIDVAADKTDCNDNKKVNSETEKLNQVKANLVDNGGDQGKIVGVMKENIAGAFTRSRSRSSESEKVNDQEKGLDDKKDVGSLTRSRSRSNEKVKTKENVEPSKTATLAKIEPSKTATVSKIEASKRPDNPKTNFSPLVAKPQTEPKEKINEQIQSNDSHTNPTKDLKTNPPTDDSPETDNLKSLNQEKCSEDPIPGVKPTFSPIDSPKTVSNSPNQPSTIPPSNVLDLNQHSSSPTNAPASPLPPSRNAPASPLPPSRNAPASPLPPSRNAPASPLPPSRNAPARPAPPARFKQKFKPNLGGSDSRVRRARKLSGGDKRTRTSSGGECSPAMQRTTSGECSPAMRKTTECSPGIQNTTSTVFSSPGRQSGPEEEEAVSSTVQTPPATIQPPPPATIQSPPQSATTQAPPQAVQPPPPVEREVEEANGMLSTPLLVSSKRISQEGSSRRTSIEGSSKLRKDELVVCKKGRTRKISGPKFPEKPHNQLMLRKSEHKRKFQSGIPARQRMTMFDLIYYNPEHGKRMSTDEPEENPDDIIEKEAEEVVKNGPEELPTEPVANIALEEDGNETPKEEDNNAMPVPQVKVGPNGEIILDEASTIVETTQAKEAKAVLQNSPVVFENSNRATNYGTWSKKRKHSDWSDKETLKFYRALSVVGTDFSMMASLFSAKTRQELKLKFKKEEKINGAMIDRCLKQQGQYTDLQEFDEDSEEDSDPPVVQKRARQKSKPKKLRAGTRRVTKNRGYYSSSDAEDDAELSPAKPSSRLLHKPPAGISQRPATHPAPGQLPPTTTTQPAPMVQVRPHTISVVRANSEVPGDAASPRRASSPLLQNLLCRPQTQQSEGGGVASAPQFPPGLLAANPGLSGVKPGSLVVVASPSKTDPSSQLLHVYMVSPKNRVGSPSKALDEVINTNSGLVRARPNMSPRPGGSMSPRSASRSPSPLSRPPPSLGPSTVYAPTPSRKRTLSESSASSVSPTRKRTLSETEDPGSSTSQVLQSEEINLPVAKKSKPPEGSNLG